MASNFEAALPWTLHFVSYLYMFCGTLLVAQLVEALLYKSGGCGFDYRLCHWNS